MKQFVWSQPALNDFANIRNYLLTIDPGLYRSLVDESEAASKFLLDFPAAGSPVGESNRRKWRIGRWPYLMIYTANAKGVRVLRIHHERQDWNAAP